MAQSREVELAKKREAEKKRRQRISQDPTRHAEENRKRRERRARKRVNDAKNKKKLTNKEVRARRKKWRIAKQRHVANQEEKKKVNIQSGNESNISTRSSSMKRVSKVRAEKKRLRNRYLFTKLHSENAALQAKSEKYRMRCHRLQVGKSKKSNSPNSVLQRTLRRPVAPAVRKNLLLGSSVLHDIKESLSKVQGSKDKKNISKHFSFDNVRKYRLLKKVKPFFKFSSFDCFSRRKRVLGIKRKQMLLVEKSVKDFYEDDEVSTLSPSKNDQIVKNKIKKQKRFLTNSLQYLHRKFCEKSPFSIGYSSFCKLRPFWVVYRTVDSRDTCLCVKCENAKLMCIQLRKLNIVNDSNIDNLIDNEVFCKPITESCRFRKCAECSGKQFEIKPFDGDDECSYETWDTIVEEGTDGKTHRHTKKVRLSCTRLQLVSQFVNHVLPSYIKHKAIDRHQKDEMKALKKTLTNLDLVIHVDFAENYSCKYSREIQSVHFGGNRDQITLHTGVLYNGSNTQSFCTVSQDLNHNAVGIFHHLKPILEEYQDKKIENLHFLSDSPATQYRNRYMFYIIVKKIVPMFKNLKNLTWNFSEAGHGKGAPDGVGATIKRTCDRVVASGSRDISKFEEFVECVTEEIKNIKIVTVRTKDDELAEEIKLFSKPVKGTMKVHQVSFSNTKPNVLCFNTLSCFTCSSDCKLYMALKVEYCTGESDVINIPHNEKTSTISDIPHDDNTPTISDIPHDDNNNTSTISEGDWVVVRFKLEESKGERRWIGNVLRVNENDTFLINFVRAKRTKVHFGFIYSFPLVPDESNVYKTQILYKVPAPSTFQRALKFSVHCDEL